MNDSSSYTAYIETDANQSICPAGWRLPIGDPSYTGSKSFQYLVNQLSLTSGTSGNIQNSPVYFVQDSGETRYYQVSKEVSAEETLAREMASFRKIRDNYPKYSLTLDGGAEGDLEGVKAEGVIEWLLIGG